MRIRILTDGTKVHGEPQPAGRELLCTAIVARPLIAAGHAADARTFAAAAAALADLASAPNGAPEGEA